MHKKKILSIFLITAILACALLGCASGQSKIPIQAPETNAHVTAMPSLQPQTKSPEISPQPTITITSAPTEKLLVELGPPEIVCSREEALDHSLLVLHSTSVQIDHLKYNIDERAIMNLYLDYIEDPQYTRHMLEICYENGLVKQYELFWS